MTQIIYPNGNVEVTVTAAESIAIRASGNGYAEYYYLLDLPNIFRWQKQGSVLAGVQVTLGPFSRNQPVLISSRGATVYYETGSSPDTTDHDHDSAYLGITDTAADSDLLDTINSSAFAQKASANIFSAAQTMANNVPWRCRDSSNNSRAVVVIDDSDNFSLGHTSHPTDIKSDGNLTHNSTTILENNSIDGNFTTTDGKTITVVGGQITAITGP